MDLGVRAQESRLSQIFAPGQSLAMPPYQRSYSWGTAEALDLFSDLQEAAQENGTHFIGAVVFVRGASGQVLEIVDGQQRLTTLTILLCVLRDLESDPARAKALHALIEDEEQQVFGEPARWRLSLNHVDGPFFRRVNSAARRDPFAQQGCRNRKRRPDAHGRQCAGYCRRAEIHE